MKSILIILFLLFPFTVANFTGKVVAVLDGDTIEVMKDGKAVRVRLNGIDCPEKSQAYGQRAKQFTASLCFGKNVTVRESGKDQYGRILGEAILPDGKVLNKELVRSGYAWHYKRYSKDAELAALEDSARVNKVGLWADPDPVAPWDYRKANK